MKKISLIALFLFTLVFGASAFLGVQHKKMIRAIEEGDISKVRQLSSNMPRFLINANHKKPGDSTKSPYGETALHLAIKKRNVAIMRLILEKGASLDVVNAQYETPLQLSVKIGFLDGVQQLLAAGATIDLKEAAQKGTSPLFLSAENLFPEIVELLLKAGADPKVKNYKGQTPADVALKSQILYDENSFESRYGYRRSQDEFNAWVRTRRSKVLLLLNNSSERLLNSDTGFKVEGGFGTGAN